MFVIEDIKKEVQRLDDLHGGHVSEIPIYISKRFTRTLGRCEGKLERGRYVPTRIGFAHRLMELATEEHFLETVRHEYAHAYLLQLTGEKHLHDRLWKGYALQFGCSGKTKALFPEVDLVDV
ncbi:MAG: SprT family zinc-dependent metalloprotease [Oscillospiraceae bacterium]|nr:SprT family zinc-dependent metalloprotease [Oscillospiraceae bacterium]